MTMPKGSIRLDTTEGSITIDPMSTPWRRITAKIDKAAALTEPRPDDGQRALARIDELKQIQRVIAQEIDKEVLRARDQGTSWTRLGWALGMSKQGAAQHWKIAERRQPRTTPRTRRTQPETQA